jgi:hypothetical protein
MNGTKFGFLPGRPKVQSGIRSLLTDRVCVTWIAPIGRDAVLMKKPKRHGSVSPTAYGVSFALMHTYGLSHDKVATSTVDIVIILDKFVRGDVPFGSQTSARLGRGGGTMCARGFVLSRAHKTTG